MYELRKQIGLTALPVKFNILDSIVIKLLKNLVSSMISLNATDRPSIDEVLHELKTISG